MERLDGSWGLQPAIQFIRTGFCPLAFLLCMWMRIWRYSGNLKCHNMKEFIYVQTPALEVQLISWEMCSISQEKNYQCGGCQWFCVHGEGSPKRLSGRRNARRNADDTSGRAPCLTPTKARSPTSRALPLSASWSATTFPEAWRAHVLSILHSAACETCFYW